MRLSISGKCRKAAFIIFAAALLFISNKINAEPVSISILSILKPAEVRLTLKSPERGFIKAQTISGDAYESILLSQSNISIRSIQGSLALSSGTTSTPSLKQISIGCSPDCEIEVEVPGKISRLYSGGFSIYSVNNTINIVLTADIERLAGWIAASEMAEHTEPQALRSFAIVARSFLSVGKRHPEMNADFCDTTHCQVFQGPREMDLMKEAVQSTKGIVLTYNHQIFRPFYSRLCGGKTSSFSDVWNGPAPAYPFYSVSCPCADDSNGKWRTTLTSKELYAIAAIRNASVQQNGNLIQINGDQSSATISTEEFRTRAGRIMGWRRIPANRFTIVQKGSVFEIQGAGIGHHVGLCQTGAAILAKQGRNYFEILSAYFPNTELRHFNSD